MLHKEKASRKQNAAASNSVNHSEITPSGTIIHQSDIIDSGVSDPHDTGCISYIVYREGQRIMVCSHYESVGNDMICCFYGYERVLCCSNDEYRKLKPAQIRMEAYYAWNAGKRHHTDDKDFFDQSGIWHLM